MANTYLTGLCSRPKHVKITNKSSPFIYTFKVNQTNLYYQKCTFEKKRELFYIKIIY